MSETPGDETRDGASVPGEDSGALLSVLSFLLPFYRRHGGKLLLLALCVLAETCYNVAFPLSLKYLIDDALLRQNRAALLRILLVLGALAVLISAIGCVLEYLNAQLSATVLRDIRHRMFEHLQTLSLRYCPGGNSGEIVSRFSTDLGELEHAVRSWIGGALTPSLELLAATVLLFSLSWRLALAAMLIWPLTMIGPKLLAGRTAAAAYRKKELEAATLAVVQENVAAQPVVQAFGLRGISSLWFRNQSHPLARVSGQVNFLTAMSERSVSVAVLLLHLLILAIGASLAFRGRLSVGALVTFESVFWELSYNIGSVGQFLPELLEAAGGIRHIQDLLRQTPGAGDRPGAIALPRMRHSIEFENASFGYNPQQRHLKNVNLRIPCGSRAGIVGPSGAGKSTILNLLLGLHEPSEGRVLIDGIDLRGVTRESLSAQIGVVFQETFLFNLTIRENIRLGKPGATDAQVESAARAAEIHDFIRGLPSGYDTLAGERGCLMSGGQRQRIAIARAIVRDPAILLLDEATSALDPATELAILDTLNRLARGRTLIFATHRLAAMVRADLLFVLVDGRLDGAGSPQDLFAQAQAAAGQQTALQSG